MGRTRTDRTVQRVVRLTTAEDEQVSRQAAEFGLTAAAFLRKAGLRTLPRRQGVLDRDMQKEVWRQVAGMARNLNQLTKYTHEGGAVGGDALEALRIEVRGLVGQILEWSGR